MFCKLSKETWNTKETCIKGWHITLCKNWNSQKDYSITGHTSPMHWMHVLTIFVEVFSSTKHRQLISQPLSSPYESWTLILCMLLQLPRGGLWYTLPHQTHFWNWSKCASHNTYDQLPSKQYQIYVANPARETITSGEKLKQVIQYASKHESITEKLHFAYLTWNTILPRALCLLLTSAKTTTNCLYFPNQPLPKQWEISYHLHPFQLQRVDVPCICLLSEFHRCQ